ncbi:ATP-grasp domain-containing protein [Octadecabacter sp. G9-8]|uniref:ATP-grasp domain-containing protein n=1 Tax=Octadecabacter dasysiphoniae TaxID=2909341 RepID=A0ABS9CWX9_9RHOB|nr:ATP-grasp domain-containing protein [Octadecabacter dasysiphoniae]MCF2870676.1 ATP-grasp domain-containing protein [Octadecabacter dasysiphoniae]
MTPPNRILITGARAPVALHLCRLLASDTCQIFLADTYDAPLSKASNRHSGYIKLPPPRYDLAGYGAALAKAVAAHKIDLIIPTSEEVFFLAILAERGALTAPLLAPDISKLAAVHDKFRFIELARSYGLNVPVTTLITCAEDLFKTDPTATVYKPVWSRFASAVLIKPNAKNLGKLNPTAHNPWVAQQFIEGNEISVYAVARNGKLVTYSAYQSVFRAGKGAGVCFAPLRDRAVQDWVSHFIEASGWNGQISFDMIRQTDGSVLPLECNPRATSGLHFFTDTTAFPHGLWAGTTLTPDVTSQLASRLALWVYGLPQAIKTGQLSAFKNSLRHAGEILDWPDDHAPVKAQFRALREIIKIAIKQRISLQQASTRDIEWNGPDAD